MPEFPNSITFGRVVGRFLLAVADGDDGDDYPDAVAAVGTIQITPVATEIDAIGDNPAIIVPTTITCSIDNTGLLIAPNGKPGLWLVTGEYKITPSINNAKSSASFNVIVRSTHTAQAPMNLALEAPLKPSGQQVFVVNQQIYLDTLAARDAAVAAAGGAQGFGPSMMTYNPDGSVATVTEGGVLTTLAYNPDGTINTETRLGKVRTWAYNSSGFPTGSTVTDAA